MMNKQNPGDPTILAFAGSTRKDSYNKKLARLAAHLSSHADTSISCIELNDFPLPLYDGDLEQNEDYPENAKKLKQIMQAHQGFLIASPEYNGSLSGVLKNTIDWVSRSEQGGTDFSAFQDKIAAIVSASPGKLGGLRGLAHLRIILSGIGTLVLPKQLAIPFASKAFDEDGQLVDENSMRQYQDVVATLIESCHRLH